MKEQYQVLFQRGIEEKKGTWLNGGNCYGMKSSFDTIKEAEECKNIILQKEKSKNGICVINGMGIEIEYENGLNEDLKLRRIKIMKRLVSEWEEV